MKIVIAPDSFKGSLTSKEAGNAIAEGIKEVCPEIETVVVPVADGGEGLLKTLIDNNKGSEVKATVHDPAHGVIEASWGYFGDTAVIESAAACGLTLIDPDKRNPGLADSYGVGELIRAAVNRGFRKIIVGLGGSAVNDGGTGMLRALGYRFLDRAGNPIASGCLALKDLVMIDTENVMEKLEETEFIIAADVRNPLTGPEGASIVFAPQKGASEELAERLDGSMKHYADIVRGQFDNDFADTPGAGAAGGMGFAFLSFLNAGMRSGIDLVLDDIGFDDILEGATLVITGEGCIDRQTCMAKAPFGILKRARQKNIPVIAFGGRVCYEDLPLLGEAGFRDVIAITDGTIPLKDAMNPRTAAGNLRIAAERKILDFCRR